MSRQLCHFGVGATEKIALALDPGLPPEANSIPIMAAHQTSLALRTYDAREGCARDPKRTSRG